MLKVGTPFDGRLQFQRTVRGIVPGKDRFALFLQHLFREKPDHLLE
jgi:hypothetical protein